MKKLWFTSTSELLLFILWLHQLCLSEIFARLIERPVDFSVEENCPIGTVLGMVGEAEYPTHSDNFKFVLGRPSNLFAVDGRTGLLRTIGLLDAEELCSQAREHEKSSFSNGNLQLTTEFARQINCSTDGRIAVHLNVNSITSDTSLLAIYRVTVQIHDVDDNEPVFEQTRLHIRLKEVFYRKDRRLDIPCATDADLLDEHRRIGYYLATVDGQVQTLNRTVTFPFRLEVNSNGQPQLVLTSDLDAEIEVHYRFVVTAYSLSSRANGKLPKETWPTSQKVTSVEIARPGNQLLIDIEVEDVNDNEPKFEVLCCTVNVSETTKTGTTIYQLNANDADITAQLIYSLGSSPESEMLNATFLVKRDGRVQLLQPLDYESRRLFHLPIEVSDGEFVDRTQLIIRVEDQNDEPPAMEINPSSLTVEENIPAGKIIGRLPVERIPVRLMSRDPGNIRVQLRVVDPDSELINGNLRCWEPDHLARFQVLSFLPDPSSTFTSPVYDLATRVVLDRETLESDDDADGLKVYLVCSDGNDLQSEFHQITFQHTSTMTLTVKIRDDNDNHPVFSQPIYHATIHENNAVGSKIIQVHATDDDEGDNSRITYTLLDRANFKVDNETGWVTANLVFDREMRDSYQVTIVASDHGSPPLSSTVMLNLTILDTNDHHPLLNSVNELPEQFGSAPRHTGRLSRTNRFFVLENSPPNTYIGDVLATDADLGQNAKLSFSLIDEDGALHSTRFRLLRNGSLFTAVQLDREEKEHYYLAVRISDQALFHPRTSTGTIAITVLDVNDNSPNIMQPLGLLPTTVSWKMTDGSSMLYDQPIHGFEHPENKNGKDEVVYGDESSKASRPYDTTDVKSVFRLSIHENTGHIITTAKASDPDRDENGRIIFKIVEVNQTNGSLVVNRTNLPLLQVEENTGLIFVSRSMKTTDLGIRSFYLSASDNGKPTARKETKLLLISVEDIPAVGGPTYQHQITGLRSGNPFNRTPSNHVRNIIVIFCTTLCIFTFILLPLILCTFRKRSRRYKRDGEKMDENNENANNTVESKQFKAEIPVKTSTVEISTQLGGFGRFGTYGEANDLKSSLKMHTDTSKLGDGEHPTKSEPSSSLDLLKVDVDGYRHPTILQEIRTTKVDCENFSLDPNSCSPYLFTTMTRSVEQPVDNTKLNLNAFVNVTCQPNTAPFSHQLTLITLDETAPILSLFLSEPIASDSGRGGSDDDVHSVKNEPFIIPES
ncbi:hypothetical protein EG68_00238 [Paragonimus skrjabini miyazakii]|uniref:Cadherin domain-containing protein n=1 Tax=Paragonimus skrjabini miyazakii TaxID=59628 RepID=A0A8S9ZCH8_9TREM|nr:hypothetical protein EG68_00238 [Paragonimus skrjabini miyazakii]